MTTHAAIRPLFLDGPAGRLEALLNVGSSAPSHCALLAHPHPLFGGTMHNKVVFHAMKALNSFGFPVLRFNFRGVGASAGEHDFGRGEIDDLRCALDWLRAEFHMPIVFAGFSFGAAVGLRAACPDANVDALIALGLPVNAEGRGYAYPFLSDCSKPKLFVSGGNDQFAADYQLHDIVATAAEPKQLIVIPGADHFFAGHLEEMRPVVTDWLSRMIA